MKKKQKKKPRTEEGINDIKKEEEKKREGDPEYKAENRERSSTERTRTNQRKKIEAG
jgi:hypothetical protein